MEAWRENIKTNAIETGGNRSVVPSENATNLKDGKEIKQSCEKLTQKDQS